MKKFFLIVITLSLFMNKCWAVELTLQDCLNMALADNTGFKTFEMNVLSGEQEVSIHQKKFFPTLGIKGNYIFRDESDQLTFKRDVFLPGVPPYDTDISLENKDIFGLNVFIKQPLYTGRKLLHSYKKSKIVHEEEQLELTRQRKLLTFKVKRAYYNVLKEKRLRETQEQVIEYKKQRLKVERERYKEGYINKEEVLQIETDIAFAELNLYKMRNKEDLALSRLKNLIHFPDSDSISLENKVFNGSFKASLKDVQEAALINREELKMSLLKMKTTDEEIKIAKSGFSPEVSLIGGFTLQEETLINRPQVWELSAQIDWPLFEWGQTRSKVTKVKIIKQKLQYSHDELRKAIMMEVEEAWRAVKENELQIRVREKNFKTNEYKLSLMRKKYAEGKVKLIDVKQMELETVKSNNDYMVAIIEFNMHLSHLHVSTSIVCDSWLTIPPTSL